MLESMTKTIVTGVLLDTLITAAQLTLLQRDGSRTFIARRIIRWLETGVYPFDEDSADRMAGEEHS